jgi:hypothetical protein
MSERQGRQWDVEREVLTGPRAGMTHLTDEPEGPREWREVEEQLRGQGPDDAAPALRNAAAVRRRLGRLTPGPVYREPLGQGRSSACSERHQARSSSPSRTR